MNTHGSRVDGKALKAWFRNFLERIPIPLTLIKSERNEKLRPEILLRCFSEVLADDERAQMLGLPNGCRIREGAKIIQKENLQIGEYCWIGENAILDASGGLKIGAHTSVGLSVFIWTHSSHLANLSMNNEMSSSLIKKASTRIGSGCFIAGPAVILPGVTIGDKVLIRPFSTVEKDVPNNSIVDRNGVQEGALSDESIERMLSKHMTSG